jgi:hypothetical protein
MSIMGIHIPLGSWPDFVYTMRMSFVYLETFDRIAQYSGGISSFAAIEMKNLLLPK